MDLQKRNPSWRPTSKFLMNSPVASCSPQEFIQEFWGIRHLSLNQILSYQHPIHFSF